MPEEETASPRIDVDALLAEPTPEQIAQAEAAAAERAARLATINAKAVLTEILHLDARMAGFKARRAELRDQLAEVALYRYETEGAAPGWKVPRLGSATLAAADAEPVVSVEDEDAYSEWCMNNYPSECEVVIRIPGLLAEPLEIQHSVAVFASLGARVDLEVAGAFLTALERTGLADVDGGRLIAEGGEIVPGVKVTRKEPYLTIRLLAEAKARALAATADLLGPVEREVTVLPAADFAATLEPDDEGAGDAPPPDDDHVGPESTSTVASPLEVDVEAQP